MAREALRPEPPFRAAPQRSRVARLHRDPDRHVLPLRLRSEGVHPLRGPGPGHRQHRDGPGQLLCLPAGPRDGAGQDRAEGSQRGPLHGQRQRRRSVAPHAHAPGGTQTQRRPGDRRAAPQAQQRPRHSGHADQSAAHQCQRQVFAQPVPAEPAGHRHQPDLRRGRQADARHAATAEHPGRHQRHGAREPPAQRGDRPQPGPDARRQPQAD